MTSYWTLDTLLGKCDRKRIDSNTWAVRRADAIDVVYHRTPVVTHAADGAVVYRDGGWQTVTTKRRLNDWGADHVSVYQENFVWYVVDREHDTRERFYSGMRVR